HSSAGRACSTFQVEILHRSGLATESYAQLFRFSRMFFTIARMTALDTRAVHAGRRDLADLGVHVPPIDLSTTNPLPDVDLGGASYEALATGGLPPAGGTHVYQ